MPKTPIERGQLIKTYISPESIEPTIPRTPDFGFVLNRVDGGLRVLLQTGIPTVLPESKLESAAWSEVPDPDKMSAEGTRASQIRYLLVLRELCIAAYSFGRLEKVPPKGIAQSVGGAEYSDRGEGGG
jgi:hypothetical protein